jgi:hypothetical protein
MKLLNFSTEHEQSRIKIKKQRKSKAKKRLGDSGAPDNMDIQYNTIEA